MTELRKKKNTYLENNVYHGLTNLNCGFDAETIYYFSADDFAVVLKRVQELGLGIHGIEPWRDGEYFGVETTNDPTNPDWYLGCFERFKKLNLPLQYAASYLVPDEYL